jgi:hypothetical protein
MSQTTILTVPEVRTALRLAGLPPGANSPFAGMAPPSAIEPPLVEALQQKGVVNGGGAPAPPWRAALQTLTTPTHRASLFLCSSDHWYEANYYGDAQRLIGFTRNPEECGITFPAAPSDIEALLGDWLKWDAAVDTGPFQATLPGVELTAFAAIVDAYREETLRAFVERRQATPERLSRAQVTSQLAHGDSLDSRWLCPVLTRHAPAAIAPNEQNLTAGVRSMAARGLLRIDGDAVVVEGDLFRVCAGMANIVPYAHLSVQQAGGPGSAALYLAGLKCYWIFEFPAAADGQLSCRFQGVGGKAVAAHVRGQLLALPAARQAVPAAAASWAEPAARQPEPPVRPPAPPPVEPARQTQPTPRICSKCGKPLKPGRKFCGSCGAPV